MILAWIVFDLWIRFGRSILSTIGSFVCRGYGPILFISFFALWAGCRRSAFPLIFLHLALGTFTPLDASASTVMSLSLQQVTTVETYCWAGAGSHMQPCCVRGVTAYSKPSSTVFGLNVSLTLNRRVFVVQPCSGCTIYNAYQLQIERGLIYRDGNCISHNCPSLFIFRGHQQLQVPK